MGKTSNTRLAVVLGSGGARGWAHIGVLRALEESGNKPDLVCGTSMGALVGAAYAAGRLDELENWIRGLERFDILGLLDPGFSDGGFIHGAKLMKRYGGLLGDRRIEDLEIPFVAVATDIETGREVWLTEGSVTDAVRASIAIPGMFAPVCVNDRWLVDGGLVNPVPVSVARAKGADIAIAVNLNGSLLGSPGKRRRYARPGQEGSKKPPFRTRLREWWSTKRLGRAAVLSLFSGSSGDSSELPGMFSVMTSSIDVMQDRITRARLVGEPPDVMITPGTGHVSMLEFDRADEVIRLGYESTMEMMDEIKAAIGGN